jgi:Na+-transporting NADH:ubiquinone oxidoreductase subunit F
VKLLTLRKLHKWVALFVGLQVLLWTLSGAMFAWLDHHDVQGEHLVSAPPMPQLTSTVRLAEPADWVDVLPAAKVRNVRVVSLGGEWIYRVERKDGVELRRAGDGARVAIDEPLVRRLATERYQGEGRLTEVLWTPKPTLESRGFGATWQARFDDADGTSLYFSAADGALVTTRTDAWRVFDFFWMLHTMDYAGRDDFNHPLVILAASAALWVALTGIYLLARVYRWLG